MFTFVLRQRGRYVAAVQAPNMLRACTMLTAMGHGRASARQGYRLHKRAPLALAVG